MASPTVAARATTAPTTPGTSHVLNLPTDIVSGNGLLLVPHSEDDANAVYTTPTGWTRLTNFPAVTAGSVRVDAIYRQATGTEGSTVTMTSDIEDSVSAVAFRITGHESFATRSPEAPASASGTSSSPDPPAVSPTGGAKDYLFIALAGNNNNNTIDTGPASYTNLTRPTGNHLGTAERLLNAASENPGTFNQGGGVAWRASTIAVHPSSGVALTRSLTPEAMGFTDQISAVVFVGHQRTVGPDAFGLTDQVSYVHSVGHQRTVGPDAFGVTDQVSVVVPWIPPAIPLLGSRPSRSRLAEPLPAISWTINGKPVLMGRDWTATARVPGGFDQFRGAIPEADLRRLRVRQFSTVKGYLPDGSVLWEGRLTRDPSVREGIAVIEAQGYRVKAEKAAGRLLYQSRDYSLLSPSEAAPYNIFAGSNTGSENYERSVEHNAIRYGVKTGVTFGGGYWCGVCAACLGSPGGFRRLRFDWRATSASADFELQGFVFNFPPDQGVTDSTAATVLNATSGTIDWDLSAMSTTSRETFMIEFQYNGGFGTLSTAINWLVKNLRIGGITFGDSLLASEAVADILGRLGADTALVQTSALNILPFDVRSDEKWTDALSRVADMEDRWWALWEKQGGVIIGEYAPWETVWTVERGWGADVGLVPLERFNRVVVAYPDASGVLQEESADASPDPLLGTGETSEFPFELRDVQADDTLAATVASTLAARYSAKRWTGSIEIRACRDTAGRGSPYGIRPGQLVRVADGDDPTALHRIVEVEYRGDGVRLGIEARSSIGALLAGLGDIGPPPELLPVEVSVETTFPGESTTGDFEEFPDEEGFEEPSSEEPPTDGEPGLSSGDSHEHRHGPHWHHGRRHEGKVHSHPHRR
ncbi:MAG: hypothetical protein ACRDHM_07385 [Actinomycetota bacterium]